MDEDKHQRQVKKSYRVVDGSTDDNIMLDVFVNSVSYDLQNWCEFGARDDAWIFVGGGKMSEGGHAKD